MKLTFDDLPNADEPVPAKKAVNFDDLPDEVPDKRSTKERVQQYKAYAEKYGKEFGEDPALILALVHQESGGRPGQTSGRGAEGLAQIMPATQDEYGVTDPDDPDQAFKFVGQYLQWNRRQVRKAGVPQDEEDAAVLASYNYGPGNFKKMYSKAQENKQRWQTRLQNVKETRDYVASVLALRHDYKDVQAK